MSDTNLTPYRLPFPHVLRIEPAAKCNLACIHCPTGTVDMERGIMKAPIIERALAELSAHRDQVRVVVLYHGGEPFLNKRFPEMLRRVKAINAPFVKIDSNAMVLTDAVAETMVREKLDKIIFSTDGLDPADNNRIRVKSDYATVVANIKRLVHWKRRLGSDLPAIHVSNVQFLDPIGWTGGEPEVPAHLRRDFADVAGDLALEAHWAIRWPHMRPDPEQFDIYIDPRDNQDKRYCDHVHSTITIRWNGDVVPCCYDLTSQLVMGNILTQSLDDIWNGPLYLRLRRSLAESKPGPLCENCNVARANAYLIQRPRRTPVEP